LALIEKKDMKTYKVSPIAYHKLRVMLSGLVFHRVDELNNHFIKPFKSVEKYVKLAGGVEVC